MTMTEKKDPIRIGIRVAKGSNLNSNKSNLSTSRKYRLIEKTDDGPFLDLKEHQFFMKIMMDAKNA